MVRDFGRNYATLFDESLLDFLFINWLDDDRFEFLLEQSTAEILMLFDILNIKKPIFIIWNIVNWTLINFD